MTERQRFAHQHEIHVGERADEGEQDAEADAEARPQWWVAQMLQPDRKRRRRCRLVGHHRRGARMREIDQHGAGEIERCEEIEVCRQTQMVGDAGGNQPADQIARDIAGDVGGERAAARPARCIPRQDRQASA